MSIQATHAGDTGRAAPPTRGRPLPAAAALDLMMQEGGTRPRGATRLRGSEARTADPLRDWPLMPQSQLATRHALARAQQRCIPAIVDELLDEYGEEQYDGHGGIKHYFSRRSIARMSRELGGKFIERNAKLLRAYRVVDARTGQKLTCGWLLKRIRRR